MSSSSAIPVFRAVPSALVAEETYSNEMPPLPVGTFTASTPFGALSAIPIEVRLKIYRPLIERGQMAILRTSRAINEEALDNFFKYAVCRLGFNLYVRLGVYPNRVPWGSIQELELRVRFTSCHDCFSTSRFNNWLQRISAFMTDVKACKIRFDCQPEYYLLAGHFAAIETLVAFQKVTLTIAVDAEPDDILSMRRFETRPQLDVDRDMYLDMHCEPYERRDEWWWGYGLAENVLKRTLGSAVRVEDDKGVHLEFYPKQHWCSST